MTVRRVYACNVCGVERKEANHWFVARFSVLGISFTAWTREPQGVLDDEQTKHVCGQVCSHRLLDDFLSNPMSTVMTAEEATA